jgi:hypothetical protein
MATDRQIQTGARASRVQWFASSRNTVPRETPPPQIPDPGKNPLTQRIPARTRVQERARPACRGSRPRETPSQDIPHHPRSSILGRIHSPNGFPPSRVPWFASSRNTVPRFPPTPQIADPGKNPLTQRIPARTRESAREDACAPA